MRHPGWVRRLLSAADLDAVAAAVAEAERGTSGEIRVHVERRMPRPGAAAAPAGPDTGGDAVLARARDIFAELGMTRTRERNGVLIYVAVEDRALAVVGDEGVHARVGEAYWGGVRDAMVERLRQGRTREALVEAVADVGHLLRRHFPPRPDDVDELPDRPSIG